MITVYKNGDIISYDEHEKTYSVLVEDKGKIAYVGYNVPICYLEEKTVDLEGKAIIPAINNLVKADVDGAVCDSLVEGNNADFIILTKNILKEEDAEVENVYIKGKLQKSKHILPFIK